MEIMLRCRFLCSEKDAKHWDVVLGLMADHEWAANLQDAVDYFGVPAADKLEEILEKYAADEVSCEWWRRSGKQVEFMLNCGYTAKEFAKDLKAFLQLCHVTDIEINLKYDESVRKSE